MDIQAKGIRNRLLAGLQTIPRKLDNLLNSTVLFHSDPLADLVALDAGLSPQAAPVV